MSEPTPTTLTATPPAADATVESPSKTTRGGGVKETVESILVAFILAFVFRAFVVEAFVIPTGSMATTLLGAHCRYHCPDCGYTFDLNYSSPTANEDEDVAVPSEAPPLHVPLYCPNCGFQMPPDQTEKAPVAYGDRILVLKYLYRVSKPKRWDVVVFKAPTTPNQNFIKRLTGLPGEAVMVLDGDVYIRSPGETDAGRFVVQPKPPLAQRAMWRLVYDNDFHPGGATDRDVAWQQPWRVAYGTCRQDEVHGRVFAFDTVGAGAKLEYDPTLNPSSQGMTDYLVYDQNTRRNMLNPRTGVVVEGPVAIPAREPQLGAWATDDVPVSDLDVRLTYQRTGGTGPFQVTLAKRGHTFTARVTESSITLLHDDGSGGEAKVIGQRAMTDVGTRPVRIELSNVDYQVTLRVDDQIVAQTTPADYAPNLKALLREYNDGMTPPKPSVSVRADDQRCRVSHLSLWRDVYYYNRNRVSQPLWALPDDFPTKTQQLGEDEFFTMGDNSQVSWDARCWNRGIDLPAESLEVGAGKVPGRFLLGRAFYVYWPAGHRLGPLPPIVPDFDGMRLIH